MPSPRPSLQLVMELAPEPPQTAGSRRSRAGFIVLSRWLIVPLLRVGLGRWLGTPIGGYILLLRVRGRRTGLIREVPLSYLVADGAAWVLAGWGSSTQWYRNLVADGAVEVMLPGRTVRCIAEDVRDPAVRARVIPRLVRAVGLPAYMGGENPRGPARQIVEAYGWVPLIRLHPVEGSIDPGPDDPGGRAWIWRQALVLAVTVVVARAALQGARHARRLEPPGSPPRLGWIRRRSRPARTGAAS